MSIKRIESGTHLSKAVVCNGLVFLAGQTADDDSLDMAGQMKQILAKIDKYLAEAGTDKTRLLSAVVYLSDMSLKADMDKQWIPWIGSEPPARACVGANLGTPKKLVEIMVTAAQYA
ncbi:MAG: RidA family protein [Rhodospirillales bacterium]